MPARFMVVLTLLAVSAFQLGFAATMPPLIDFRDSTWMDAHGVKEYSTVAAGIPITVNAEPASWKSLLYWDSADGFGVDMDHSGKDHEHAGGYEEDEIEVEERFWVTFTQGPVLLSAIYFSDLFVEKDDREDDFAEEGFFRLDGGKWIDFDATLPVPVGGNIGNGEHVYEFTEPLYVTTIEFKANPAKPHGENHEYSVMGLNARDVYVPEPGTWLLLLFGGMVVLKRLGRRHALY